MKNLLKQTAKVNYRHYNRENGVIDVYRVQVGEQMDKACWSARAREEMGTVVTEKNNQIDDNDINFSDSAVHVDTTKSANC